MAPVHAPWRRGGRHEPVRPRALRAVPAQFRTGLDAVLTGADGNTYLFKGRACYDVRLGRELPDRRGVGPAAQHHLPTATAWTPRSSAATGRPTCSAATSSSVYAGSGYLDTEVEGRPAADRRALGRADRGRPGLRRGRRHLPVRAAGRERATAATSCTPAPTTRSPTRATRRPAAPTSGASRRSTAARASRPRRCCSTGTTRCT